MSTKDFLPVAIAAGTTAALVGRGVNLGDSVALAAVATTAAVVAYWRTEDWRVSISQGWHDVLYRVGDWFTKRSGYIAPAAPVAISQCAESYWEICELAYAHSLRYGRRDAGTHYYVYEGVDILAIGEDGLSVRSLSGKWSKWLDSAYEADRRLIGVIEAINQLRPPKQQPQNQQNNQQQHKNQKNP